MDRILAVNSIPVTSKVQDKLIAFLLSPTSVTEVKLEMERRYDPTYWYECPYCSFKNELSAESSRNLMEHLRIVCTMCSKTSKWDRMIRDVYH